MACKIKIKIKIIKENLNLPFYFIKNKKIKINDIIEINNKKIFK
jgi:hypothetical protein